MQKGQVTEFENLEIEHINILVSHHRMEWHEKSILSRAGSREEGQKREASLEGHGKRGENRR